MKRAVITQTVAYLPKAFYKQGLQVGLDAFAPVLADIVGQDLSALGSIVDRFPLYSNGKDRLNECTISGFC